MKTHRQVQVRLLCILTLFAALTLTAFSQPNLRFQWSDFSNNEIGFIIERAPTPEGEFEEIARVAQDLTFFVDYAVAPGESWSYRVASYNAAGTSAWSNIATGTVPPLPPVEPPDAPGDPTVITVSVSIVPGTSGATVAVAGP